MNESAGGWGIGNELGYLESRGIFDSNVVVFVPNTGDPSQPPNESAPIMNYPTARPWTAIGEAWSRYVVPRLKSSVLPSDAGTTIPPLEVELRDTADNRKLLSRAKDFCAQHGAAFGIVLVPYASFSGAAAERPRGALRTWTSENHVPFIDVSDAFVEQDVAKLTYDGIHLRAYGDEVVANEIQGQWKIIDDLVH